MELVQLIIACAIPQRAQQVREELVLENCGLKLVAAPVKIAHADNGSYHVKIRHANETTTRWTVAPVALTMRSERQRRDDALLAKVAARSIAAYATVRRAIGSPALDFAFVRPDATHGRIDFQWMAGRWKVTVFTPVQAAAPAQPVASSSGTYYSTSPPPTPGSFNAHPGPPPLHIAVGSAGGGGPFSSSAGRNSFASSTPPFHASSLQQSSFASTPGTSPQLQPQGAPGASTAATCSISASASAALYGPSAGASLPLPGTIDELMLPAASIATHAAAPTAQLVPLRHAIGDSPVSSPTVHEVHVPFGAAASAEDLGCSPGHALFKQEVVVMDLIDACKLARRDLVGGGGAKGAAARVDLLDVLGELPHP